MAVDSRFPNEVREFVLAEVGARMEVAIDRTLDEMESDPGMKFDEAWRRQVRLLFAGLPAACKTPTKPRKRAAALRV
jgi:hypothetical protein